MIILEAALLYAKVGIPVFPVSGINSQGKCTCNNPGCSHPGKHPLLKGGHKIATTNIQQIEQWWAQHPNANIGIPTGQASGLYIVDIDKKHDGAANYQAFLNGLPDIIPDATLISATGGGGFHLIYQAPINKMLVRCGTNIGGLPGVDFRGNGGYIVAPPSLHVSGTIYQWCQGVELDEQFDLTKLVPLPLSIATLLNSKRKALASSKTPAIHGSVPHNVAEGGRNAHLFTQACQFRMQGISSEDLYSHVWTENESACTPPLGAPEVQQIVTSALSYDIQPTQNKSAKKEDTTALLMVLTDLHKFWLDDGKKQFVTFPVNNTPKDDIEPVTQHFENWPIKSPEYHQYLSYCFRKLYNQPVSKGTVDMFLDTLAGNTLFEGEVHKTYTRTAHIEETVYIDSTNPNWDVYEITAEGWHLHEGPPPVKFLRTANVQPLPIPDPKGTFDSLRAIFRLQNNLDYILVAGWITYALAGKCPYPVLAIEGIAGSSKSTMVKQLRNLVDPRKPEIRTIPQNHDDLAIYAYNAHLLAIDNVSKISQGLSDLFCGIATGTGISKRELYTDINEIHLDFCRPIIINSINSVIQSSDLADRSIRLTLPPMSPNSGRLSISEVDTLFQHHAPKILGAALNSISKALPNYEQITDLPHEIRMMDFAKFSIAAGDTLTIKNDSFIHALMINHYQSNLPLLEENVLNSTLLKFIQTRKTWSGTPTQLLPELRKLVPPSDFIDNTFPSMANQMTRRLNRAVSTLKLFGVHYSHSGGNNHKRRLIRLTYQPETSLEPEHNPKWTYTIEPKTEADAKLTMEAEVDVTLEEKAVAVALPSPTPVALDVTQNNPLPIEESAISSLDEHTNNPGCIYQIVNTTEEALEVLHVLSAAQDTIGLSTLAAGTNPRQDKLYFIQLFDGQMTFIFDVDQLGDLTAFAPVFGRLQAVAHNAVLHMSFLQMCGLNITLDCTMLAQHVLTGRNDDLEILASDYLNLDYSPTEHGANLPNKLLASQLQYAAQQAELPLNLFIEIQPLLEAQDSLNAYELVVQAQPFVVDMQLNGMGIDCEGYQTMLAQQKQQHIELLRQWQQKTDNVSHTSSKQLSAWLEDETFNPFCQWPRTKTGAYSTTNQDILLNKSCLKPEALHTLENILLPLKKLDKKISAFGDKFLNYIDEHTGRIHSSFNLTGAVTGRMSSSKPNLQQIPRLLEYRKLFKAAPDSLFVISDYSQMELRVAATLSDETTLLNAYKQGQDTHQLTAALLLGKEPVEISKEERQLAKAVNFGLLYGQSAAGLQRYASSSYGVSITLKEATAYRNIWFVKYPAFARWHHSSFEQAKKEMSVTTPSGRKRYFTSTDYNAPSSLKPAIVYNTPIQGGAAEVLLAAMGILSHQIASQGYVGMIKPIAVIHDEIILEAREDCVEQAKQILEQAMINGMLKIFPAAETLNLVEVTTGGSWADK